MIIEYHRPANLGSAMELLKRPSPETLPLAGGTSLLLQKKDDVAVIDVQDLMLNTIHHQSDRQIIGAAVTLQQLVDEESLPDSLRKAARAEASFNNRQVATIGGTIASAGGRSPLLTVLLTANAEIVLAGQEKPLLVGEMLPLRGTVLHRQLITEVVLQKNMRFTYHKIAKTPDDVPLILVGVAKWTGGRTRIVIGGPFSTPKLAMDGTSDTGADIAAANLLTDQQPYLREMAGILVKRCLQQLDAGGNHGH